LQSRIQFAKICDKLKRSEADLFLIIDCCYAGGALIQEPFAGRKCQFLCSISENKWARAPGYEGSFTRVLITALLELINERDDGFSTSDLYRKIYFKQHEVYKPLLFDQSLRDFGKIWLRPLHRARESAPQKQSGALPGPAVDSKYSIDIRLQLASSLNMVEFNHVAKALQYIPHVSRIDFLKMRSPQDDLREFMRAVWLAKHVRPILQRRRVQREQRQARLLRRTNTPISNRHIIRAGACRGTHSCQVI
jgi:hypothetical protein